MFTGAGFLLLLILLGAIQGTITGFLLFFSRNRHRPNGILAIVIWLMSLASLNIYLSEKGLFYINSTVAVFHALIPMVIIMPVGPLIWFYIKSSVDPAFRFTKKHRIHFLPVLIDIVPQIAVILFLMGTTAGWFPKTPKPWGIFIDEYNVYADIPRWLSTTVYILMSTHWLKNQRFYKKEHAGDNRESTFRWLRQFLQLMIIFLVIWGVFLVPYVLPFSNNWLLSNFGWYPVFVPISVLIYWMGIKGYIVSSSSTITNRSKPVPDLPKELVEKTRLALQKVMQEEKYYLKQDLTISRLAGHIGVPQKIISIVINQYMNKSFTEYLNEYRLQAFKIKILEPEQSQLTITGVAFDCGFSSQPSFQRIFKQHTGMTPSQWRSNNSRPV